MELSRSEKLLALQIGYQKWAKRYPQENDDDIDSYLIEMQETEMRRLLTEKNR